ncbi:MAG TPA: glycosyltransferase [Bacteroidales bacterium]|nr:glycosyltransferase [Bacteroidales bacterium]
MTKVLIIGTAYPYRGGLAVYNERLAKAFADNGDDVKIETFKLQYPGFLFPGKTQYAEWKYEGNVSIQRTVNSINPFNWIKVGRRIRKEKYDVVIIKYWLPFMGPCFGTIARQIRKNGHTKVISILDNVVPHEKRIGDKTFTRWFVKHVDGFVSMSESVQSDLVFFNETKPRELCPHPLYDNFGKSLTIKESIKHLKLDDTYKYILFFGLIRDYKGLDLLLEAFANDILKTLPIKLIIAGEFYSDSEKYYQMIEKLNLTDRVIVYPNFIPDNEVNLYFGAASLVVQPYKSATQSGVTQIAYHFEKPMVVTNVCGLGEIVPNGKVGYVVDIDTVEIANAIADFFSNNRAEQFVQGIKEEKQKYSWERMINTIQTVYKQITL